MSFCDRLRFTNRNAQWAATAVCVLASGLLLTASRAHAQIYTSGLTTSAANPNIYFSTFTGASSYTSFTGSTDVLSYNLGGDARLTGLDYKYVAIYVGHQGPPYPSPSNPGNAYFYNAGSYIDDNHNYPPTRAFLRDIPTVLDPQ